MIRPISEPPAFDQAPSLMPLRPFQVAYEYVYEGDKGFKREPSDKEVWHAYGHDTHPGFSESLRFSISGG